MTTRIIFLLSFVWTTSLLANNLAPIFPLKKQSVRLPFWFSYVKDPSVYRITNKKEFRRVLGKLKKMQKNTVQSRTELHKYFSLLAESCFYFYRTRATSLLSKKEKACHIELIRVAEKLLKASKLRRSGVIYNSALSYFALQKYREAYRSFSKITSKSLVNPLSRRAGLVSYLIDLEIKKSVSSLSYNRLESRLDLRGKTIVYLATARFLAGINLNGKLDGVTNPSYSKHIKKLSPLLLDLQPQVQEEVLAFIVGIVSKSEKKINWQKFPIRVEAFSYTNQFASLLERRALYAYSLGMHSEAVRNYKQLLPVAIGDKKALVARRILLFSQKVYDKDRDIETYKKAIIFSVKLLKTPSDIEKLSKHIDYLISSINKNLMTIPSANLPRILATVRKLVSLENETKTNTPAIILIAKLQLRMNDYKGAVDTYYYMFSLEGKKSTRFLDLAIKYQSIVANWSDEILWTARPAVLQSQRLFLKKMYKEKIALSKKPDWHIIALVGLLALNLKKTSEAYYLWINNLKHKHKNITDIAIGIILKDYMKKQDWIKTEALIRECMRFGLVPKINNKKIKIKKIYANALYQSSLIHEKEKRYEDSLAMATDFFKNYPKDARQAENTFRLAELHIILKKYTKAMSYFIVLSNKFQSSPYYPKSLLLAGNLAKMQSNEKIAIAFYNLYFRAFPNSNFVKTKSVVYELISLYKGLRLYSELQHVYNFIFSSAKFNQQEKHHIELEMMQLEERHGNVNSAKRIANKIIANASYSYRYKIRAIVILARGYYARRELAPLLNLKSKLNLKIKSYQNIYNELSFYIAESYDYLDDKSISIYQKTPSMYLQYLMDSFAKNRSNYLEACRYIGNNFCLPAFLSLIEDCDRFADKTAPVEPAAVDTKQEYTLFLSKKSQFLNYLKSQKNFFKKRAMLGLKSGNTIAEWLAKGLLTFPGLNLRYINGYFSEADFIQFNALGKI